MRHILILSLSFLFFSNSYAYRSIFGQNSTEWIITYGSMLMTGETDTFFISKDTTVYGVLYKKVSSNNSFGYEGLLREDTVSGKVWYRTMSPNAIAGLDTVHHHLAMHSIKKAEQKCSATTHPYETSNYYATVISCVVASVVSFLGNVIFSTPSV